MGMSNKQIGWSNESNLLWAIGKQIGLLTNLLTNLLGSLYEGSLPKANGAFFDSQDQSATINVNTPMLFRNTSMSNSVFIQSDDTIKVTREGDYNIAFSSQFLKTTGGVHSVTIWLEKNGVAIPNTGTRVTIPSSGSYIVAAWNFFEHITPSDDIRLIWRQDDAIIMQHVDATVNYPAIPSVILTVNQVN